MRDFLNSLGLEPDKVLKEIADDLEGEFSLKKGMYELIPLKGGASTRGYVRVKTKEPFLPDGSKSLILMVLRDPDPNLGIEEVMDQLGSLEELPFINILRYLKTCDVAVPELYCWNKQCGLIYLEDLGDTLLRDKITEADREQKLLWFKKAIDELLKLQLRANQIKGPDFLGKRVVFNRKMLLWELEHFKEWGIEKGHNIKLGASEEEILRGFFDEMVDEILGYPYILNHRDYHMDNLMIKNEAIRVIDFQDAFLAPLCYDLACLLYDRDTSQLLGREVVSELSDYYLKRYVEMAKDDGIAKNFQRHFIVCVLHRALKVVGRFYYIAMFKGKKEYLYFLPSVYEVLKEMLEGYGSRGFREFLLKYLPEIR